MCQVTTDTHTTISDVLFSRYDALLFHLAEYFFSSYSDVSPAKLIDDLHLIYDTKVSTFKTCQRL